MVCIPITDCRLGLKRKKLMVLVPLLNSQTSKSNGDKQTAASPAWLELNPISVPQPTDKSHRKASILTATQNNTKSKGSFISNGVFLAGWIGKKTSGFWFWYYFFPMCHHHSSIFGVLYGISMWAGLMCVYLDIYEFDFYMGSRAI